MSCLNYFAKRSLILALMIAIAPVGICFGQDKNQNAEKVETKQVEECKLPEVRDELAKRVERDQKARKALIADPSAKDGPTAIDPVLISQLMTIDRENTKWLQEQVKEHGWLGKTLVGKQGAQDAWLLVQHADQNRKFQRECLELMVDMPEGEVSPKNVAYLTDRVLVAEGKPQRFGTQMSMKDGKPVMGDVQDPDNLDKRRAEVGLDPIAEYMERIKEAYSIGDSKSDDENNDKDSEDKESTNDDK